MSINVPGTGLKYKSVLAQEFPSPRFQFRVKIADCDRWHSVLSGFGGGVGSRGVKGSCGDGLDLEIKRFELIITKAFEYSVDLNTDHLNTGNILIPNFLRLGFQMVSLD